MDMFKKEQDLIALRQSLEETYANNPQMRDALRTNADALDMELRCLPSGVHTSVAIDHLRTQSWFSSALDAPYGAPASEDQHEQSWGAPHRNTAPEQTPEPYWGAPPTSAIGWYGDNDIAFCASRGPASPAIWPYRHDPTCPSEFYRGYLSLLGWISNALRQNPTLPSLRRSVDVLDAAIKSLPADERQNGAAFALMNVCGYAEQGTIPQILATLDQEMVCIAHCFICNRGLGI